MRISTPRKLINAFLRKLKTHKVTLICYAITREGNYCPDIYEETCKEIGEGKIKKLNAVYKDLVSDFKKTTGLDLELEYMNCKCSGDDWCYWSFY